MRINYFDFLRGLAILMVVAIHTNSTFGFDSSQDIINVTIRQLFNSAVPLFLAISGYFLASKCLNNLNDIFKFWKHQIPKVYIPVLIWSLPLLFKSISSDNPIKNIVSYAVCGYSVYYFVAYYTMLYLASHYKESDGLGGGGNYKFLYFNVFYINHHLFNANKRL